MGAGPADARAGNPEEEFEEEFYDDVDVVSSNVTTNDSKTNMTAANLKKPLPAVPGRDTSTPTRSPISNRSLPSIPRKDDDSDDTSSEEGRPPYPKGGIYPDPPRKELPPVPREQDTEANTRKPLPPVPTDGDPNANILFDPNGDGYRAWPLPLDTDLPPTKPSSILHVDLSHFLSDHRHHLPKLPSEIYDDVETPPSHGDSDAPPLPQQRPGSRVSIIKEFTEEEELELHGGFHSQLPTVVDEQEVYDDVEAPPPEELEDDIYECVDDY